jgi:hypothetical protein
MTTFREWLTPRSKPKDPAGLTEYLHEGGTSEGWNSEFKKCTTDVDYGVREAVAALANERGGEVFVGVDDAGVVKGSGVKEQAMNETLRQRGLKAESWYVSDLLQVISQTISVPFSSGNQWAYVLEVRERERPVFVIANDGRRVQPIRSGSDTLLLDNVGSVEWYRETSRGTILRACYSELSSYMGQLSAFRPLPDGLPERLPYLTKVLEDDSLRRLLHEEDIAFLVGRGEPRGGRSGGVTDLYYGVLSWATAALRGKPVYNRNLRLCDLEGMAMQFADLDNRILQQLQALSQYIQSQGYAV